MNHIDGRTKSYTKDLNSLLEAGYQDNIKNEMLCVDIDLSFEPMKQHDKIPKHYLELILLHINLDKEKTLQVMSEKSL